MARAQNSAKGRLQKKVFEVVTSTTGIIFHNYHETNGLLTGNSTGLVVRGGGIKLNNGGGVAQITANSTAVTLPAALKVSGASTTITGNSTSTILSGSLRVSGKSPTVSANTTGTILSAALYISARSTKPITMDSTGKLTIPYVAALPNTRVLGGIALFRNTTGASLVLHTTGTTWEYVSLVGTAPVF